jgi:cell division transport system permease protein
VVTFNVRAAYLQSDSLAAIQAELGALAGVADVYYQESLIEKIAGNVRRLGWIALAAGLVFLAVAVFLIHATIRLALHANRFLIKTQELVGATWHFISRPYLQRSLRHGLLSGLLTIAALFGTQLWLQSRAPELDLFQRPAWTIGLYLAIVLLGVLLNYLSTYYVVRKYLRLRVDELY